MDIRLCRQGSERELVDEFCRKIFDTADDKKKSEFKRQSETDLGNPYYNGPSLTAIAIRDGNIVGHVTSTAYALWVDGQVRKAHWLSGIHVLPEVRRMGIATKLAACITDALPLITGVLVVEPSRRAFVANDWIWPGKISDFMHIANPKAFLATLNSDRLSRFVPDKLLPVMSLALRLSRVPLSLGINCVHRVRGISPNMKQGGQSFKSVIEFDSGVDELWESEKNAFKLTHVRNAEYLNWQFPQNKGYRKLVCHTPSDTTAFAIYNIKEYGERTPLAGLKALNVIDIFWRFGEPQTLHKIIRHLLFLGYHEKVDIIMISGNHPSMRKVLRRNSFIKMPSTVRVGFHSHNKTDNFAELFNSSYFTRGYADAAGTMGA